MKAYSAACDKNKEPILKILSRYLVAANNPDVPVSVLEIGSGTGQHAIYFASHLPGILWQPTDVVENQNTILQWLDEAVLDNCCAPEVLDLDNPQWPVVTAEHVFTANTLHIIDWSLVLKLFDGVAAVLKPGGYLFVYGPFNYHGEFSSESNASFNLWLKERDERSGIRDFEAVVDYAAGDQRNLRLVEDCAMPANNRMLIFQKS